jgi:hypothetical protein
MQRTVYFNIFWLILLLACTKADPLEQALESDNPAIREIMDKVEDHDVQVLFTTIARDKEGNVIFTPYEFQVDENRYFYPASTVKLPLALLALEKLNELQNQGFAVDKDTPFKVFSGDGTELLYEKDSTSATRELTLGHLIKKIFLVSDNEAYNLLFDFLGRDRTNERLHELGYASSQIMHKFKVGADNENTLTYVFGTAGEEIYRQGPIRSTMSFDKSHMTNILRGRGYINERDSLIEEPFDFSGKNALGIRDLDLMTRSVLFPESVSEKHRFDLTEKDREFLKFWMSRTPGESDYPKYPNPPHYDSYVKFIMFGDDKESMPDNIRSYNKVGLAYGTLTETAYIHDEERGIEFMLTMTLLVNDNGVYNDGIYEYDETGIPFMAELGRLLYAGLASD